VTPHIGRTTLPALVAPLSDEAKAAARRELEAAVAAVPRGTAGQPPRAAPAPQLAQQPAHAPAAAAPAVPVATAVVVPAAAAAVAAVPAAAPGASSFAVSTRPLRTRAEADQVRVAMDALLRSVGAGGVRVDVLPQGDDWRVTGWPFTRRGDADKARALLLARGMRVEVVGF
jgi:hypothetical protein